MTPEESLVEYVVKAIVDSPDEVKVERVVDDLGVLIKLRAAKNDMPKIVGRSGTTAKALRTLVRVIGGKTNERINLKILEPDGSEFRREEPAGKSESPASHEESAPMQEEASSAKEAAPKSSSPGADAMDAFK